MRIGFDAKRLYNNFTGLGNYSRTLVRNLQKFYPDNQYHLYTPKLKRQEETDLFLNHKHFQTHVAEAISKSYWRSFSLPHQLQKDGIELYHGLSNQLPVNIQKSSVKSILTIHDLIPKILPETYLFTDRKIYDWKFRNSCKNADRIIAISESTKKDIVKFYDVDPEIIDVIYQACDPSFGESNPEESDETLKKYNIPSEYLIYVGSIEKRKNLKGIIEAFKVLKSEIRIPLVIIGGVRDRRYKRDLDQLVKAYRLEKQIIWITDLKNNNILRGILQRALALVYPSFYEGFGLPVVEALLSKTPVITSKISSLPEAGGPKSFYVDPSQSEEIAHGISQVIQDTKLRSDMIEVGYQYATEKFAPQIVTQQLMNSYEAVVS